MINKLIEGIFYIINKIFTIIFTPFFTTLFALFPSLSTYFSYILDFLNRFIRYGGLITQFLFIPSGFFTAFFGYLAIKYSIYILALSVRFIVNVYNKLKP